MKGFVDKDRIANYRYSSDLGEGAVTSSGFSSEPGGSSDSKFSSKASSLWSGVFASAISIFQTYKPPYNPRHNGWTAAVKRAVTGGSMRRLQERVLGTTKAVFSASDGDIWLLGACYRISSQDSCGDAASTNRLAAFVDDFSSRVLMTYRKGFDAIEDTKFTSDVNWGCMLRSSQMLVAQALLFHWLGRSWRKSLHKPFDQHYINILQLFGDSETSSFSIHNLLRAGKSYGLAAGSWVGPYAMCRSWETLARGMMEETVLEERSLPMALYIVSGDEDGERGGAPVLSIEDAFRHCCEFSRGQVDWTPILLLIPLVLGLEKVNPRYLPSLKATFTFPQSLGILGGKPGTSTYIVGVQEEKVFFLDPHDVQPVIQIRSDNPEVDTASYHSSTVRHIPLDSIDPSLAIGFYCRNKDDFDDFCCRAAKLADESNGAPLFTIAHTRASPRPAHHNDVLGDSGRIPENSSFDTVPESDDLGSGQEDEWQLL